MNTKGNKIEIITYVTPETFRAIEETRRPNVSRSAFCAMALEELFTGSIV